MTADRPVLSRLDVPQIARDVAPILMLDRAEPFRPVGIGVTVFDVPGPSPSSKFHVALRGAVCIEYATYWDHDIGHLYDLEHIWVHLNAAGEVTSVEASFHGQRHDVDLTLQGKRPVVWCEAGKHAHFQNAAHRDAMAGATQYMTAQKAGLGGVHLGNRFADEFGAIGPYQHRLARVFLGRLAFAPALGRGLPYDMADGPLCPWSALASFIPQRVQFLLADMAANMPHFRALFLDCGDTLVDEGTEIKRDDGSDVVIEAKLIDGAASMMDALRDAGFRLCLVADGPRETFENVLKPHGLWDHFEAHVISGDVGVRKPDQAMFTAAMQAMELSPELAAQVPMIGNNLDRDILGANRAGHPSLFFRWVDRRRTVPNGPEDTPTWHFTHMDQCLPLLTHLEIALDQKV
ncbi:hypothetical protein ACMU_00940 [Actibacterium mucosum KCTC 23349]|uniref:Hydrolase n=1 Tax=Actibacterium mucosum KCTC 23349 TaxID=1454373 RepID=A0A037ZLW0_9RHOB|nr:HAD family hydrolase [Actibacterium mucosum]KAJ57089.1 hypothetical protein ACMU_00940 [Actibacterium mucosum KCTC 23349]